MFDRSSRRISLESASADQGKLTIEDTLRQRQSSHDVKDLERLWVRWREEKHEGEVSTFTVMATCRGAAEPRELLGELPQLKQAIDLTERLATQLGIAADTRIAASEPTPS